MRRLAALVALAVVPVLLVGCSDGGNDDGESSDGAGPASGTAIEVNSTKYSTEQVLDELRTIAANPKLAAYFRSQDSKLVPRPDTIEPETASSWVNTLTHLAFIDRELKRRNLTTDGVDREAARATVSQIFGGLDVFAAFPQKFQDLLIDRQERIDALKASFPPVPDPTEAELRDVFTRLQGECPDAKLVSQIWRRDKGEAEAIAAELAQGADFATLARARSEEPRSGARGGVLTCIGTEGYQAYPAQYREAAEALELGAVSEAVPGFGGFFVLKVTPMTYESAIPLLESQFRGSQADPFATFLVEQTKAAKPLKVAKRFATLIRTAKSAGIVPNTEPVDLSS